MAESGPGPRPGPRPEPEPELQPEPGAEQRTGSCLTTQQLQQNLQEMKRRQRPVRLLFEIPSARVLDQDLDKHVVYQVVVMRSGSFDSRRVWVERRYRDFSRLHRQLQEEFREQLEDLVLPRKLLTGNFCPEVIAERRLALQDYLARLYAVRCVRRCPLFPAFFTEREQRRGHALLRAGQFGPALRQLQDVLELEDKLSPWQSSTLSVPTLCALAVCHRDLERPEEAAAAAHRALPAARRYGLKRQRAALLELLVDVGYELGRPVAQMQEELRLLREAEPGEAATRSLKELVVQEFL